MEGVIDLVEESGAVPDTIYLSALAYGTADGASLAYKPPQVIQTKHRPQRILCGLSRSPRDSAANGIFDRLDPERAFQVAPTFKTGMPSIAWPVVYGHS